MSDPVGLAGTIGTWVAVFLALAALLGVLPAYFLYKRSRTEKAQALALVHDPTHTFVPRLSRLLGVRINQTIKVPDFTYPPQLAATPKRGLKPRRSKTSWVDFAHVMTATFPDIRIVDGANLLHFDDGQFYLPVHYTWVLIFGVLHRYTFREDYGLPLGAVPEASMTGQRWKYCLSGESGMLFSSSEDMDRRSVMGRSEVKKIFFEMHTIPNGLQDALPQETMPL
ncbi:hypothetical protein N431DRAFT_424730 [Stipitochalara longipes BDJ]|nr:hypothetical protein N431DRAFT_424730 [Stipitochalara longipes BDJ]